MKYLCSNNTIQVDMSNDEIKATILEKINARGREDRDDAFYIGDLGDVIKKYNTWKTCLPRVQPFYAVKCNDNPAVLSVLAKLGTGFDCASKSEIQTVTELGVAPDRIIYANPCKQNSHIRYAATKRVRRMTFDNETELHKVKAAFPDAQLVLRILPPDDTKCQCRLSMKYGAHPRQAAHLLRVARDLQLDVIGVSFHVGSGCFDASVYADAVVSARAVFDAGAELGFRFSLLDIGGGFPGQPDSKISFQEICGTLVPALDACFPASSGVQLIAEPGRFFVASAFTLAVNIIAKRTVARDSLDNGDDVTEAAPGADEPAYMYYVNDGVYGSFNCLLYDHAEVEPVPLEEDGAAPRYTSSVWGPTCDGLDCIRQRALLPELQQGDWLVFRNMGAYTLSAASTFNGMPRPRAYYTSGHALWRQLQISEADVPPLKKGKREAAEAGAALSAREGACPSPPPATCAPPALPTCGPGYLENHTLAASLLCDMPLH